MGKMGDALVVVTILARFQGVTACGVQWSSPAGDWRQVLEGLDGLGSNFQPK